MALIVRPKAQAPSLVTQMTLTFRNSQTGKSQTLHDILSKQLDEAHKRFALAYEQLQEASVDMLSSDYDMALVDFAQALQTFKIARRNLISLEDEEKKRTMDGLVAGFPGNVRMEE